MAYTRDDAGVDFMEEVAGFRPEGASDSELAQAARRWIAEARELLGSFDENGYPLSDD